jgi:two-component system response regulator (stage 0 sporulation protein A)
MQNNKLYILDNNDIQRTKLLDLLSKDYDILGSSNDGKLGLEQIEELKPNLVIADIVLQNYDGFEFLEKLEKLSIENKPKVLILSSIKGEDFAQKAIDLGANYYLAKPVLDEVLIKRINEILFEKTEENKKVYSLKSSKNRQLDEKISNIFITVGIPAHIRGYQFLREAIKMAIEEPDVINSITKQLYPTIAQRFSTSASKVERAIRHAIEVDGNRGKIENINSIFGLKVYNSNEKPTNGEFIALVADKMIIEGV